MLGPSKISLVIVRAEFYRLDAFPVTHPTLSNHLNISTDDISENATHHPQ